MNRQGTSIDGALYELVARGTKDGYFFEDSDKAEHPFRWRLQNYNAVIPEIRNTVPQFPPKWGRKVEWEMDLPGDILTDVRIVIDLPSWLPSTVSAKNMKSLIQTPTGTSVGYCHGIAYFLFDKLEIYQDGLLIQEVTGDNLYILSRTRGSWNQRILSDKISGIHDGSPLSIQRNATPGRMTLSIPFMGCQGNKKDVGFPICATRDVKYRIVATLRPFEHLIQTSASDLVFDPCGKSYNYTPSRNASSQSITSLRRDQLEEPTLTLQTTQWYLSNADRAMLANTLFDIPYRRFYNNVYYLGPSDYFSVNNGGTSVCTRDIDAVFLVQQISTYFRNSIDLMSGNYSKTSNTSMSDGNYSETPNTSMSDGNYISEGALYAAGKTREGPWPITIWQKPIQHGTQSYSSTIPLWIINWTVSSRFPNGGINFSSLDKPFLQFTLQNTASNPILGQREVRMDILCESWAVYHIEKQRGSLLFEN